MNGRKVARLGWLLGCMLVVSLTDLRHRHIPKDLALRGGLRHPRLRRRGLLTWRSVALGAALLGALFGMTAGFGKAGMGDATLAAVRGLALGWQAAGPLLVGTALALLVGLVVKRKAPYLLVAEDGFPLAPAFLLGLVVVGTAAF